MCTQSVQSTNTACIAAWSLVCQIVLKLITTDSVPSPMKFSVKIEVKVETFILQPHCATVKGEKMLYVKKEIDLAGGSVRELQT